MRVVIDTNVLLSALISPFGPPHQLYRAWRAAKFRIVTSRLQLEELRRVSHYPKIRHRLHPHQMGRLINILQGGVVLQISSLALETADPDDAYLLAMAIEADADYLITGDRHAGLLTRGHIRRTRIVTPATFCALVL